MAVGEQSIVNQDQGAGNVSLLPPKSAAEAAQDAMRIATWALVILYCLPLVLILYSFLVTDYFSKVSSILLFFVGIGTSSNDSLGIVHRVLLPIIGGFAPLAFASERASTGTTWLIVALIVGIAISVFMSAVFDTQTVQDNLRSLSLFDRLAPGDTTEASQAKLNAGIKLIASFLARTQEALGMYVMLLFGLKLEKAVR